MISSMVKEDCLKEEESTSSVQLVDKHLITMTDPWDDAPNGLEFQIALDSLNSNNFEPLQRHLARLEGSELDQSVIRKRLYDFEKDKKQSAFAQFDLIDAPDFRAAPERHNSLRVQLPIPDQMYKYHQLQPGQIRLLRLGPEEESGQVNTLELHAFEIGKVPSFNALSYVWGQPERVMPLSCNNCRVMVTQNLRRAIEKSFLRFPRMWLWADGICINQEDMVERGQQVSLMGDIYHSAELVIAHTGHHAYNITQDASEPIAGSETATLESSREIGLRDMPLRGPFANNAINNERESSPVTRVFPVGDSPATSQSAISLMNYLSRLWASDDDFSVKGDADWQKRKVPEYTEGENEKIWSSLFAFWRDDWFYRSWVLQEAVLGKGVILLVGDAACSLDSVITFWDLAKKRDMPEFLKRGPLADEFAHVLHLNPVITMKALRDLIHFRKWNRQEGEKSLQIKSDLISLLSLSRINLASDPRDKVYSLLGLAKGDSVARSIVPDYSETNTVAALYRDIAAKYVEAGRGRELLQHAGMDQKIPDLPSWVPDWTYQSRSHLDAGLYNCSGNSLATFHISEQEPGKLRVRGAIIDTIRLNGMAWRYYSMDREQSSFAPFMEAPNAVIPDFTDEDGRCVVRTFAKTFAHTHGPRFDPSEGLESALARTLVMDRTWRGQRTASEPSFLESFNAFERLYGAGIEDDTPATVKTHKSGIFEWVWDFTEEEESELRRLSWQYEVALQEAHKGRRFCLTGDGHMCTTPYDTQRDDVVVILEGLKMPFVLRKSGEDWKLIGDCYVHGIMDGELVTPPDGFEAQADDISIDGYGKHYALRTASGFAKFQEFRII
ncbi:hypothetical protein D0Z07_1555 [Hyphodiscus hymeniophilus]|uniref:Heterokaryon incompatibility domain-containing protein n=1 Tax=Hyphodiscus hymeniophilus TaxID=353542 RepID=A0A9P7AZT1_9HELO|nr:hypothetical protein D0Z07_1555 [Hyphodiscus hymeniophilus]